MRYDIFQVWLESPEPPSELEMRLMRKIAENLPSNSTYTLISTYNYFTDLPWVRWVDPHPILDIITRECPHVEELFSRNLIAIELKSELVRLAWACMKGNEHAFYLDSDIEVNQWPQIDKPGDVWFFPWSGKDGQVIDCNTFFSNGNQEWVRDFYSFYIDELEKYARRRTTVPYSFTFLRVNKFYHDAKTFRNSRTFPPGCFAHHSL